MMDRQCLRPEDLAGIQSLPDDDARKVHLTQCPRCRAFVRRYADFMDPVPLPAEADAGRASVDLKRRLDEAIPELHADDHGSRPQWWRRHSRSLLAFAAAVVCCVGILSVRQRILTTEAGPATPVVVRGDSSTLPAFQVRPGQDGPRLAWQRPAEADAVVVVLLDSTLQEIGRIPVAEGDAWTLSASHRLAAAARYARVIFMQADDMLASTRTLTLP